MARRRKYAPAHSKSATFALNITSMTDMFTIMLVFLLQTYSNAEIQVVPEKGMELPLSSSEANPILAVQLSLTKEELKFEQKTLATLSKSDFKPEDMDKNDSNFIPKLFEELQKLSNDEKQKETSFNAGTSAVKPNPGILDGRVILKADANLPYGLLRKVMYTSSMAGFPKLKLATVVGK
jgi:biopolymer transport protein ExbD